MKTNHFCIASNCLLFYFRSSVAPSVNSSPAYSNNVYGLAQTSLPVITSSSNSASFGSQSSPVLKSPRSLYLPSGTANFPEISTNNISENFNKLPVYQGASTSTTAPNPCGNEIQFISIWIPVSMKDRFGTPVAGRSILVHVCKLVYYLDK